jgi:hypothetical protein
MRYLAYFTVPTLAGWLAGSLMCVLSMSILAGALLNFRDIYNIALTAGLFIIAPTFLLCILPYCGVALHALRNSNVKGHCRFHAWPLFLCLLLLGSIMTFAPAALMLRHEPLSFRSSMPPENPILWFLPFIPYAAVVTFLSRGIFRFIQNHDT